MTTSTKTRKPRQLKPITGVARWINKPAGPTLWGRIAITNAKGQTTEYDVRAFLEGDKIIGWGLAKDDDEIYSIDITRYGWECSCPDAGYHNRECKHAKALRAAVASIGIAVASPKPEDKPKAPDSPKCGRDEYLCACYGPPTFDDP